jgi:hypothetical protein
MTAYVAGIVIVIAPFAAASSVAPVSVNELAAANKTPVAASRYCKPASEREPVKVRSVALA